MAQQTGVWGSVASGTSRGSLPELPPLPLTQTHYLQSSLANILPYLILITALGIGHYYPFYHGQTECYGPIMYPLGACSEWLVPG